MSDRQEVRIVVYDSEQYDGNDWPTANYPATLIGAIEWFQSKLALIPKKYRLTAQCEIDSVGSYEGSHYAYIEISYRRPETDEEMTQRFTKIQAEQHERERLERAKLAELRAKYGESR
jgi:hypothetical protein